MGECVNCGHAESEHVTDAANETHCEGDGDDMQGGWMCDCDLFEEEEEEEEE